ncbi:MAG: hypothetical protein OXG38_09750 [Chloroflexi bacterium]|nr:hypothetical protein [Chloroflexota bacterium]
MPESNCLTRERFTAAYDAIGAMMHAHSPDEDVDYSQFLVRAQEWDDQIHELLGMHKVFLLGVPDAFFLVQMNVNGLPTWTRWDKVEPADSLLP